MSDYNLTEFQKCKIECYLKDGQERKDCKKRCSENYKIDKCYYPCMNYNDKTFPNRNERYKFCMKHCSKIKD